MKSRALCRSYGMRFEAIEAVLREFELYIYLLIGRVKRAPTLFDVNRDSGGVVQRPP